MYYHPSLFFASCLKGSGCLADSFIQTDVKVPLFKWKARVLTPARRIFIKKWNNPGSDACNFFAKVSKTRRRGDSSEKSSIKEKLATFKSEIQCVFNKTMALQQHVELLKQQIQQYPHRLNLYQGDASEKYGQINPSYEDLVRLLGDASLGIREVTDQLCQSYCEAQLIQEKPIQETSTENRIECVEYFLQKGVEDAKQGLKSVGDKLKHLEASFEEFKKQLRTSFVVQLSKTEDDLLKRVTILAGKIDDNRDDLELLASNLKSQGLCNQVCGLVEKQALEVELIKTNQKRLKVCGLVKKQEVRLKLIKTNRERLKEKRNAVQQAFEKNENIEQAVREFQKSADEFSDLVEKCQKEEEETSVDNVTLGDYMKRQKINRPPIPNA